MAVIPFQITNIPLGKMHRQLSPAFTAQWKIRTKQLKDMNLAFAYTLLDLQIKQVSHFDGIIDVSGYPAIPSTSIIQ